MIGAVSEECVFVGVVFEISLFFADHRGIQRRLGDIDMPVLHELAHLAEEESEQQNADVAAVYIGVAEQDDFVVADFVYFKFFAEVGADGVDERLYLFVANHAQGSGALHIQDFPSDGENGHGFGVAGFAGRSACGVAFHHIQLGLFGEARRAVRELAGQPAPHERRLAANRSAGFFGFTAGLAGEQGFFKYLVGWAGVFFQPACEVFVGGLTDELGDLAVAELALGLAFKLGFAELHAHDGGESFVDVFAGQVFLVRFDLVEFACIAIDHIRERSAEAVFVGAACGGVDAVGVGVDAVGVEAAVPLEGDLKFAFLGLLGESADFGEERLFGFVEMTDEIHDAVFGVILHPFAVASACWACGWAACLLGVRF